MDVACITEDYHHKSFYIPESGSPVAGGFYLGQIPQRLSQW